MKKKIKPLPIPPLPWVGFLWSDAGHIAISYRKADGAEGIMPLGDAGQDFALRAVNAHAGLVEAMSRAYSLLIDGLPCACYGQPKAIYAPGEKCIPCAAKAALRAAGEEV